MPLSSELLSELSAVDPSKLEWKSCPPHGPHAVTVHAPGWETITRLRDGDMGLIAKLQSIYPRFCPFGPSAQVSIHIYVVYQSGTQSHMLASQALFFTVC
jgi:hypothetical protein